jgi:hypothetical protein
MTARAFDTLEMMDSLKQSGVPEEQAKTHVGVLVKVTNDQSTKQDLLQVEQRLVDKITIKILKSQIALYVGLVSTMFALFKMFLPDLGS